VAQQRIVYRDSDGLRRTMILDSENPHRVVVQTEQSLDGLFDDIAHRRDTLRPGANIRPIASIPVEIYERMALEGWGPDDEAKWLNSAEAEPFRVWRGRVGRDR